MQKPPKVVAYAIVATTVQLHDDICLHVKLTRALNVTQALNTARCVAETAVEPDSAQITLMLAALR